MAASIGDVALRAGVSTATVSRALRGARDVSEATRTRVLQIARDLNYVASPTAASLVSGRTRAVGVVIPYLHRWFSAQVLTGIEATLRRGGYDLLLHGVSSRSAHDRFFDELPVRKRVDALLVVALPLRDQQVAALADLEVPVGLIATSRPGFPSTHIDDVAAARMAVRHLVQLGHRRIAFIGGPRDDPMEFAAPVDRRRGYWAEVMANGLPAPVELQVSGRFTVGGGEQAMESLLDLSEPPTAVFAASDEMALGAIRAARRRGRRVPEELSVVGFDDQELAVACDLTTVAHPAARLGSQAAEATLAALRESATAGTSAAQPDETVVEARLVVRTTTARPAG